MLHGEKVRYALTTLIVFIIVPGLSMAIQARDFTPYFHHVDSYSPDEGARGINEQVRLARGVFLIAKKSMTDPNFAKTVLLITQYEETGTVGLVLNRPLDKPAVDILPQLQDLELDSYNLYLGGPVRLNSLRLLVHAETDLGDYYHVIDGVFQIDDLRGVRQLLGQQKGQFRIRLYAGYAGWFPGQLERELMRGDWHLSRADSALIFTDDTASLWERLIEQMDMQWVELNYELGIRKLGRAPCLRSQGQAQHVVSRGHTHNDNGMDAKACGHSLFILKKNINSISYY